MRYVGSARDFTNKKSMAHSFRKKRMRMFFDLLGKNFSDKNIKILDVGGSIEFWETFLPEDWKNAEITILNLSLPKEKSQKLTNLHCVCGNAISMPEFQDKQFDVVFSNSVIEHVGTLRHQKMMADEMKRVGKFCFLQTPNRYFPIETHFSNVPFFRFFPEFIQLFILKIESPGRSNENLRFYLDSVRLLNFAELVLLFPGWTIKRERFFCFTKSFIVYSETICP
jgi:ubiquinone/menaquinone biosynthesis C-methylase UbiE